MKMYSNTINIVHSHFRRKEPLYYLFRPHFCHEQTPVLGTYSFLSISSKKYLKHHDEAIRYQSDNWRELKVWVENAIPSPSPRLERLLYSPPQVPEGEEDRVGGVEVSLHTSGLARAASPGLDLGLLPWSVKQKYDPSKSLRWPSGLVSLEVHVNYHSDTKRPHHRAWDIFCWK